MQIELPSIDGNSCNYCEQYTRASSGDKCLKKKTSNPFGQNVCRVSVLTTFSAPPQILLHDAFCPIPENEEMMVMVSFGATAAGFEQ